MCTMRKTSLFSDPGRYAKAYYAFENLSAKYEEFSSWSQDFFREAVVDRLPKRHDPLRMLGIGSGAGEVEYDMIQHLLKKFQRIENRVIEPCVDRLSEYKKLVKGDPLVENVDFLWENTYVEEFQGRIEAGGRPYHFVSALHSLYHVTDPSDTLKFMYDSLAEEGILLVILSTADSGFGKIWSRFPALATGDKYLFLHTGQIKDTLEWMDIPYYTVTGGSSLDITSCFDSQSLQGRYALDFITQIVNFRGWASQTLLNEVLDYLKSPKCSNVTSDGRVLFNDQWEAVMVQKT